MKLRNLFWSRWKIIRTYWPYPSGYGTYRKHLITRKITVLDTGLTKEQAKQECKILNSAK